jgi:predicted membrane-bound dolichyl-phosphate-mannose-protein mannosyltransferase
MNIAQRIVLILGGLALAAVLLLNPIYWRFPSQIVKQAVLILSPVAVLYIALGTRKNPPRSN